MKTDPSEALTSLGFTGLESEIYAFLLTESPATGYRIAQAIGKQVANVYKAIQTLESKGAITIDAEASRRCTPIPVEDLLGRIAHDFEHRRSDAKTALLALHAKNESEARTYPIPTRDAAVQQARALIGEAKEHLVVRFGGSLINEFAIDIDAAKERGVRVIAARAIPQFGDELSLVADGKALLVARIDGDKSVQGYWARIEYLALSLYYGLVAEACIADIHVEIEDGAGAKRIAKVIANMPSLDKTGSNKN